jgi:hypothetical protein
MAYKKKLIEVALPLERRNFSKAVQMSGGYANASTKTLSNRPWAMSLTTSPCNVISAENERRLT